MWATAVHCDYSLETQGTDVAAVLKSSNQFMQSLLKAGLVQPGDTGLGLKVSEEGRCIGKDGQPNSVFLSGPQLIDRDFEAIAVPELRNHAKTAAQNVLSSLKAR